MEASQPDGSLLGEGAAFLHSRLKTLARVCFDSVGVAPLGASGASKAEWQGEQRPKGTGTGAGAVASSCLPMLEAFLHSPHAQQLADLPRLEQVQQRLDSLYFILYTLLGARLRVLYTFIFYTLYSSRRQTAHACRF